MECFVIKDNAESEIAVSKSRFIGFLIKADSQSGAEKSLAAMRKKYYDASHICYAYVLGDASLTKFSDDGEPGGTAGKPMLEILRHANIVSVLAVVVRYFGGVKLGTGGLARAYCDTIKQTLLKTELLKQRLCASYSLTLDYSDYNQNSNFFASDNIKVLSVQFEDKVNIILAVINAENFCQDIENITKGKAEAKFIQNQYVIF